MIANEAVSWPVTYLQEEQLQKDTDKGNARDGTEKVNKFRLQ